MRELFFDPLSGWTAAACLGDAGFRVGPGAGAWLAIAGLALQSWLAFDVAKTVDTGGALAHAVGGWGAPLGIDLAVDGLSAAMLVLTQTVALLLAVYARSYFKPGDPYCVWVLALDGLFAAAWNGLFVSADLFNICVTLRTQGLAAAAGFAQGRRVAGGRRPLRYLLPRWWAPAYLLALP
ncbi:MAG: hypothetical protein IPN06_19635 [Burkholderiales bacterium]|nr:hypothetical protein [Burkholderiales bacterium]